MLKTRLKIVRLAPVRRVSKSELEKITIVEFVLHLFLEHIQRTVETEMANQNREKHCVLEDKTRKMDNLPEIHLLADKDCLY